MIPEVEVAIAECPIFEGRVGEQGRSVGEVGKGMKYKRVGR